MRTRFTDNQKAGIFTGLVLVLAVAAALVINATGLDSNQLAWGAVWSITPVLATVIMLLVVTREGYSREGWKSLALHRLGLRVWWIAFFGTLLITVVATAAVWATPLASVTTPPGGVLNSVVRLVIQTLILATTFSLAEEIGHQGVLVAQTASAGSQTRPALDRSGLGDLAPAADLSDSAASDRKPSDRCAAVLRSRRSRKLLLRLPEARLRQPVAFVDRARDAQQRLGDHGRLHRHILALAGQRLSPRRLRHCDHGRCSHRGRTGQPACPARWGRSPPGQSHARARPDRTSVYHFHLSPLRSCAVRTVRILGPSGTSAGKPVITRRIGHSVAITERHNWRFWMSTILRSFGRTGADAQSCDAGHDGVREQDRQSPRLAKVVRLALDCGVNVFDTANVYARDRSEEILERPRAVRNHVAMTGRAAGPLRTGARALLQSRLSWLSEQ
jgi:hypothetical protein